MATSKKRKPKYAPSFIKQVLALKEGQGLTQVETVRAWREGGKEPFKLSSLQRWIKEDRQKKEKQANTLANRVARAKKKAQEFKPKKYVRSEPKPEQEGEKLPNCSIPSNTSQEEKPSNRTNTSYTSQDPDSHNISYTPPGPVAKAFLPFQR